MSAGLSIEQTGSKDTGACDCCGRTSRSIWGFVSSGTEGLAGYFVHWTLGHVSDQGANIDLVIGRWGSDTTAADRSAVALAYRLLDTGPAMMVIDASSRQFSHSSLVGRVLNRNDVIGTPLSEQAFAIADALLSQDDRVAELLHPERCNIGTHRTE